MINQKITFPQHNNFSDDELSFLPYFVFFNAIKVSTLTDFFRDWGAQGFPTPGFLNAHIDRVRTVGAVPGLFLS